MIIYINDDETWQHRRDITQEKAQHFAKMKRYLEHNNKHGLKYYEEQGKSEGQMTDVDGFCELYYRFLQ